MKTAIVTGASRGLGREIASALAIREGCRVIALGRDVERLVDPVDREPGMWIPVVGDIKEQGTLDELENDAARYGADMLFNVAGVYVRGQLHEQSESQILDVIATNLVSAMMLTRRVCSVMRKQGSGIIVNINSIAATDGGRHETAYAASKAGLAGFSRALRMETRDAGVIVLDVYLGAMKTEMLRHRSDLDDCIDAAEAASLILNLASARKTLQVEEVVIKRRMHG